MRSFFFFSHFFHFFLKRGSTLALDSPDFSNFGSSFENFSRLVRRRLGVPSRPGDVPLLPFEGRFVAPRCLPQ